MGVVEDGLRAQIRNIEASSGRTMAEWTELIRATGRTKHAEIIALLKGAEDLDPAEIAVQGVEARGTLDVGEDECDRAVRRRQGREVGTIALRGLGDLVEAECERDSEHLEVWGSHRKC